MTARPSRAPPPAPAALPPALAEAVKALARAAWVRELAARETQAP